jgi:hypothetical protein
MDVSDQLHAPATLLPSKYPQNTHFIGGWVGPRNGLDAVEWRKISLAPTGNQTPAVQPVARCYMGSAILVRKSQLLHSVLNQLYTFQTFLVFS